MNNTTVSNKNGSEMKYAVKPCATAHDILGSNNASSNLFGGDPAIRLPCDYKWTREEIIKSSPFNLPPAGTDQTDLFLHKFLFDDIIWIGDERSSGRPEHINNFRSVAEWLTCEELPGSFVSTSTYQNGVFSRRNDNVLDRRFFVIGPAEGHDVDTAAIIRYLHERDRMWLNAIVSDGEKFWGWFTYPGDYQAGKLARLIRGKKCDSSTYSPSSFFPIPGAEVDGRQCELVWFGDDEPLDSDDDNCDEEGK
jgi:hypothetical protein